MNTKQFVLASRPKGTPTLQNFRKEAVELPQIQEDEVALKGLFYSVDPYMRGRMNDAKSYVPPFTIDLPLEGGVVAEVTDSKSSLFKTGDLVVGVLPWREQMTASAKGLQKIDPAVGQASYFLGILGMTGLTAHLGLTLIGQPKAGETVVVSGAAGAVGVVVGQIAKIKGCHVVGIAGSDEKVNLLKEDFGFDEAINYKTTPDMQKAIAKACPKGVDIYFDNVGGDISDAVINNINFHARIPLCGQISLYNNTETPVGPRIQPRLLTRSALMQGFIVSDFAKHFPDALKELTGWVMADQLKFTETIIDGFDQLPSALLGLFKGENTGKMVVKA
ncbi:NADP-dependent oxidoreductase [Sunxiuqinia sp. sy24]|uniref:NADP-dependent oxidoreductase n=1 Tax=Sunxiuqinia sp. sy24 TaxID=3461495 RepID=UPI004045ADD4